MRKHVPLLICALFMICSIPGFGQGVSINSNGATPDPSAMLDISSSTKGTLITRMTKAQRDSIHSPAAGLLIYNTDCNAFSYYNGTSWVPLNFVSGTLAAPGTITGNATSCKNATGVVYSVGAVPNATAYTWTVPTGASITSGQGTPSIIVSFDTSSGNICVAASNDCESSAASCQAVSLSSAPTTASVAGSGSATSTQITANWSPVINATSYVLEVAGNAGFSPTLFSSNVGNVATYNVTAGLTCNTSYYYRVHAVNSCGSSANSNVITVTTAACCSGGSPTAGFGTNGVVLSNPSPGGPDQARTVAVDATGMYICGFDAAVGGSDYEWRIEKRDLTTGSVIWAQTSNPSSTVDVAHAIAVDATGVYITGSDGTGSGKIRIEKRDLTTGALISGFGTGGIITEDPTPSDDDQGLSVISAGSNIYIGAMDNGDLNWRIEKRDASTGALVSGFGTGGAISISVGGYIYSVNLKADATALYICGTDGIVAGGEIRLEKRDLSTGALITSFGTNGVLQEHVTTPTYAFSFDIDASNMYIAGSDYAGTASSGQWRIEKRSLSNGAFVTAFGTSGVIRQDFSGSNDMPQSIAVDASGVYAVGYDASTGTSEWKMQKFDITSGSVIWAQAEPLSAQSSALGVALDASSLYIVGIDDLTSNDQWRMEKRCK